MTVTQLMSSRGYTYVGHVQLPWEGKKKMKDMTRII